MEVYKKLKKILKNNSVSYQEINKWNNQKTQISLTSSLKVTTFYVFKNLKFSVVEGLPGS